MIGLDEKTLNALSDQKIVRTVKKGAHRAYTERDLRAYLLEGPEVECTPKKPTASTGMRPNLRVMPFSERRRS